MIRTWGLPHNATALIDVYAAGFFQVPLRSLVCMLQASLR